MSRAYIPKKTKELVKNRANFRCEYCQVLMDFSPEPFDIDHIIPICKGGQSVHLNLALSCGGCNSFKHIKIDWFDPIDRTLVSLFHPRKDIWIDHFTWSADFSLIVGITPIGRATIDALKMNRLGLVNLRKALVVFGEHPPSDTFIK